MNGEQRIRRKMLLLSVTLSVLLILGSCSDGVGHLYGWAWDPIGCACPGPKVDCVYQSASDVASPDGQRHAVSETRSCSIKGQHQWSAVYVRVTGPEHAKVTFRLDQNTRSPQPPGQTVFDLWNGANESTVEASELSTSWRSDSELVVTYPPNLKFFDCRSTEHVKVHCVERGFTPVKR